jgi:hypothetical protein
VVAFDLPVPPPPPVGPPPARARPPFVSSPSRTSEGERGLLLQLRRYYPDAVGSARGLLPGRLELDVYIPSLHVGIEYDGAYWHGRAGMAERDASKGRACAEAGILLLRVAAEAWESGSWSVLRGLLYQLTARRRSRRSRRAPAAGVRLSA